MAIRRKGAKQGEDYTWKPQSEVGNVMSPGILNEHSMSLIYIGACLKNYLSSNVSPWRRQQYAYASIAEDLYDRKVNTKEEEEEFKEMKLCGAKQI